MIVAVEGVDGAGKNTLVTAVEEELLAREVPVARVAFPRYGNSVHADLADAALHGRMGDLTGSVHGMATLFALDRAEVADELAELSADGYVVLLDRFTASNAAYSAARLAEDVDGPTVEWVRMLETGSLGVPVPDLQVLVDVEVDEAARRVTSRAADDPARVPDAYEADAALQQRTAEAYRALAAAAWGSPWEVVTNPPSADRDAVEARARDLVDVIVARRRAAEDADAHPDADAGTDDANAGTDADD
ncbi:dTMP kinase [Corynebacterium bovis]|uniref:Thymidylate kinase n=4 Tax=Corynebacterium bovis TaxID=36808 RepID=A0A8H9Y718_9CORY|nr:dTMP kinase [Corynebacterium bovis]MBB3115668.1 dTMP kinase [Corynebacterium bovis DSM 20582 = CIP 54.80]QQC47364.1 dTMP kinase [Corynebacterium bovis]RRO80752.1 thymidylate kinase [Corynebacterium bovis]RRO82967.1 thymidylate kinase [Corynebacterium bovis]RRO90184.1 thymidylate kinase [Corynebacterium bovis]